MMSRGMSWERWARMSGAAFAVLAAASFIVIGEMPGINDSPEQLVAFFDGDRGRILTGLVIYGIALIALGWFIGALANALREAGEARLGATGLALGGGFIGAQVVVSAIAGALALNIAAAGDAGVIQALTTMLWAIDNLGAFPLAGAIAAFSVGLARSEVLADWVLWAGLAIAAIAVLHGTTWATDGFWAPGGGWTLIAIIAALVWMLVVSVLMVRASSTERATMPTTSGPAMGGVTTP
jgi:hypothetical protein